MRRLPSKGNSWPDYMVLRNGYTCTAEAKVGAVRSTGTFATRDVRRENGLVSFVIETTSSLENATTPPVKTRAHYREQKDGSLAVEMPSPTIPGFATTVDGEMHMPSISSVRSGKSASGEMTMTMTPTSSTLRDQIQPMLASGARGIEMHLKVRVGAAPEKREIRSGGKTYTDLVGIKNEFVAAEITNAKDSSLKAAFGQLRDGFLKNKTETYYARGAGQIQTVAMGIPVTVTGCKG
jgi:hypothetical protein